MPETEEKNKNHDESTPKSRLWNRLGDISENLVVVDEAMERVEVCPGEKEQ